jgi:hypothetical protein
MLWGIWSLACGWPLGLLWIDVFGFQAPAVVVRVGALAAGVLLAAVHLGLARRRDDDPARSAHLAASSSTAWLAWPATGLRFLEAAPDALWVALLSTAVVVVALVRAAWATGPCSALRVFATAVASAAVGLVVWPVVSAAVAAWGAPDVVRSEALANAIYDLDARVATRRLPDCAQSVEGVEVLRGSGARPRWSVDGAFVWYDAPGPEGRRQVHRLELATGEVRCWTCGQPGNNARPDPAPDGGVVVFDSDRHADADQPWNTEIYRMPAHGSSPERGLRRLTFDRGPDESARIGPSPAVIVWSRADSGRYVVASATIAQGHGGVRLRSPGPLVSGGAHWTAPLGWSPDARSLVVVEGNPYHTLDAVRIDLATSESEAIAHSVSGLGGVGFSADGGWLALATTQRTRSAGVLPDWLGFATARFATRAALSETLFRGTAIWTGPAAGPLSEVELGEVADWGEPTGVALAPDGGSVVLGQRRPADGAPEDRLVRVSLVCAEDDSAATP